MGSEARKTFGAKGFTETLLMDPDDVLLPEDPKDPYYDASVEKPLDEGLVCSIDERGVIHAVTGIRDGTKIKIIVGRDRTRACREVKRRRAKRHDKTPILLPVKLTRGAERELRKLVDSENYNRRAFDPVVRAARMQKHVEEGYTKEEIATMFGLKSTAAVDNALAVLDCAVPLQRKMSSGALPASLAPKLAKLAHAKQVETVAAMAGARGARASATVRAAREGKRVDEVTPPSKRALRRVIVGLSANGAGERFSDPSGIVKSFLAGLSFALGQPIATFADKLGKDFVEHVAELLVAKAEK